MHLIITRTFPPEVGGMQNLMWGLAKSLAKHYMIKVFADFHNDQKLHDAKTSFSIERIKSVKLLRKYRKANLINQYINENKNINGIIADHWKSLELINFNKKKICLIHSKEINHKAGTNLNKRVLKVLNNTDFVVANSQFTKNLAINIGVIPEKITVINPGIDMAEKLSKKNLEQTNKLLKNKFPILITVSRYDKRKNHEKVFMAIKNLKALHPNIVYICIGYGDEKENLIKLSNELKINDNIIFLENLNSNFKNALVSKSNIFVMPSIIHKRSVEGFGIAFIEAAQYGVPSLGGTDGGAADAIINNETGLLCDGNNLNEIYDCIQSMLEHKKYIELGKNAKKFSEKFYWEKIVLEYKKILN